MNQTWQYFPLPQGEGRFFDLGAMCVDLTRFDLAINRRGVHVATGAGKDVDSGAKPRHDVEEWHLLTMILNGQLWLKSNPTSPS